MSSRPATRTTCCSTAITTPTDSAAVFRRSGTGRARFRPAERPGPAKGPAARQNHCRGRRAPVHWPCRTLRPEGPAQSAPTTESTLVFCVSLSGFAGAKDRDNQGLTAPAGRYFGPSALQKTPDAGRFGRPVPGPFRITNRVPLGWCLRRTGIQIRLCADRVDENISEHYPDSLRLSSLCRKAVQDAPSIQPPHGCRTADP